MSSKEFWDRIYQAAAQFRPARAGDGFAYSASPDYGAVNMGSGRVLLICRETGREEVVPASDPRL